MSTPAKTLYVHVGPPKTGTTAVQALFRDLDDATLRYPPTGQWPDGSHNLLAFALQGARQWGNVAIPPAAEMIPAMEADLAAAPKDALISSEGFAHPNVYRRFLTAFAGAVSRFERIVPIVVLRHPIERAASDYNQIVKDPAHGHTSLPDEYLAARIGQHHLSPLVEAWSRTNPETVFLSYHPAPTLVARFCDTLGRPDLAPDQPGWPNRSLGGVGLALVLLSNRVLETADAKRGFFQSLKTVSGLRIWHGASFPFSPNAVSAAMTAHVTADLANLKTNHGIDLGAWDTPPEVSLTNADRKMVTKVAMERLGDTPDIRADIEQVLTAFQDRGETQRP